jgi:hypothetical protein
MKDFRLAAQNVNVMWNFCSLGSSLFYLSTARQETGGIPASVGGVAVLAPVASIGHPSLSFFYFSLLLSQTRRRTLQTILLILLELLDLWGTKILNFCNFSYKWNGSVARIVFCHSGYEGCYVLNKIKVLIY